MKSSNIHTLYNYIVFRCSIPLFRLITSASIGKLMSLFVIVLLLKLLYCARWRLSFCTWLWVDDRLQKPAKNVWNNWLSTLYRTNPLRLSQPMWLITRKFVGKLMSPLHRPLLVNAVKLYPKNVCKNMFQWNIIFENRFVPLFRTR